MSRKPRQRSRGQALAEFALVLPIFVVVIFGIIDMGRYVYDWNALNEASRAAARVGSVALWPPVCNGLTREACVKQVAKSRLTAVPIALTDVTVQCQRKSVSGGTYLGVSTNNCGGTVPWRANDLMTVTITRRFTLLTPIIGQLLDNPGNPLLTMTGQATVTVD
ncbi:MAG: TadE/TadG family type IV pilus assembly protein [Chloroflexota bacterium]